MPARASRLAMRSDWIRFVRSGRRIAATARNRALMFPRHTLRRCACACRGEVQHLSGRVSGKAFRRPPDARVSKLCSTLTVSALPLHERFRAAPLEPARFVVIAGRTALRRASPPSSGRFPNGFLPDEARGLPAKSGPPPRRSAGSSRPSGQERAVVFSIVFVGHVVFAFQGGWRTIPKSCRLSGQGSCVKPKR